VYWAHFSPEAQHKNKAWVHRRIRAKCTQKKSVNRQKYTEVQPISQTSCVNPDVRAPLVNAKWSLFWRRKKVLYSLFAARGHLSSISYLVGGPREEKYVIPKNADSGLIGVTEEINQRERWSYLLSSHDNIWHFIINKSSSPCKTKGWNFREH
jgi:hypothetical protein